MKPPKKIFTEDANIIKAEETLDIRYPEIIRERLKKSNGFEWGGFNFYQVLDEDDKYHTFDDVVRNNQNEVAGWAKFLPVGFIAIADLDSFCLCLSTNKDGKIYYLDPNTANCDVYAENEEELVKKMEENDGEFEEDELNSQS